MLEEAEGGQAGLLRALLNADLRKASPAFLGRCALFLFPHGAFLGCSPAALGRSSVGPAFWLQSSRLQ